MKKLTVQMIYTHCLIFLLLTDLAMQCGPGPTSGYRRRPIKRTPLVYRQTVPNVSENTLGASGAPEGRISRDSKKFKDLRVNYNADIVFKDEEQTGADRIMSERCKDRLNALAVSVMNHWPGVKLRVTEAWDEDGTHAKDSLHYEGRAIDITTDDKDRTKYGMLARLAVTQRFDWVYYESRGHVHVSCKSDSSEASKTGGCFDKDGLVQTQEGGSKKMTDLNVGDSVLTMDENGKLGYSDVMMFLDRDEEKYTEFYTIYTEDNRAITLTPTHLIYADNSGDSLGVDGYSKKATFARNVEVEQFVYVADTEGGNIAAQKVVKVEAHRKKGSFAPLTKHGTIVVNQVVASCYGIINDVDIAHMAFSPVRFFHSMRKHMRSHPSPRQLKAQDGIHWYPNFLYRIAPYFVRAESLDTI